MREKANEIDKKELDFEFLFGISTVHAIMHS